MTNTNSQQLAELDAAITSNGRGENTGQRVRETLEHWLAREGQPSGVASLDVNGLVAQQNYYRSLRAIDFLTECTAEEIEDILSRTADIDVTDKLNSVSEMAQDSGRPILLPAGKMRVDDPWWLLPEGSTQRGVTIFTAGNNQFTGTVIDAHRNLIRPALITSYFRELELWPLHVIGGGQTLLSGVTTIPTYADLLFDADYIGASGCRDSRYSPNCALGIDIGLGPTPPDGGYSGITYRDAGGNGSSDGKIIGLSWERFPVGVMHNPENGAQQGDRIDFIRPRGAHCKAHMAFGQGQSREVTVTDGNFAYGREAIDCQEYGVRQGCPPTLRGGQYGVLFECFAFTSDVGAINVYGGRAEEIKRLGNAGAGAATEAVPIQFFGFDLSLSGTASRPKDIAPVIWESIANPVRFVGGMVHANNQALDASSFLGNPFVFESTEFDLADRFKPFIGNHPTAPTILRNCRVRDATGALVVGDETRRASPSGRVTMHYGGGLVRGPATLYELTPGNVDLKIDPGTASNWVYDNSGASFDHDHPEAYIVGDIVDALFKAIGHSAQTLVLPGYRVASKASSTITLTRLYPRSFYNESSPTDVAIYIPNWAPGQALTGDTHSNTTLDNVSPTTILRDGDWLLAAAGLSSGTHRVASGGGTSTITLNKNATDTAAGKTLYYGRLNTVDLTVAF